MSSEFPSSASPPDPDRASLDRRRFLRVVGLGLSAGLGTSTLAFAQTGTSSTGKPAAEPPRPVPLPGTVTPPSAATPATPPDGPPPISEDARSLAEIVRRRYGKHLTPDQMEAVTRELDQRVQSGRRLRDAKLANGDEPDFTFRVEP